MTTAAFNDKVSQQLITGGSSKSTTVDRVEALSLVNNEWYDTVIVTDPINGGTYVYTGAADSGTVTINGYTNVLSLGSVEMAGGVVILSGIPTADPLVAGQLWSNLGALTISAG